MFVPIGITDVAGEQNYFLDRFYAPNSIMMLMKATISHSNT
jgi:hypothetical protein